MTMEGLVPHDRGVAQPGSAPRSGRGSRRFKSSRPDHTELASTGCPYDGSWQPEKTLQCALPALTAGTCVSRNPPRLLYLCDNSTTVLLTDRAELGCPV